MERPDWTLANWSAGSPCGKARTLFLFLPQLIFMFQAKSVVFTGVAQRANSIPLFSISPVLIHCPEYPSAGVTAIWFKRSNDRLSYRDRSKPSLLFLKAISRPISFSSELSFDKLALLLVDGKEPEACPPTGVLWS